MRRDFTDAIAEALVKEDTELTVRLAEQDMTLRETQCRDTRIGKWVDEHEIQYLFAALDLSDKDFGARFPEMRHVTRRERAQLAATIKNHVSECPRCSLKQGYDLEWAARIKRACQNHRHILRGSTQEENGGDSATQEGKHRGNTSPKASSAKG